MSLIEIILLTPDPPRTRFSDPPVEHARSGFLLVVPVIQFNDWIKRNDLSVFYLY